MCAKATIETARAERAARLLEERSPLRGRFSPKRWRHTLSVAETAHRLAKALEWDPADRERALLAALLHDVAKELPPAEQRRLAERRRLAEERRMGDAPEGAFSGLAHAEAGARLAETDFGIHDEQVLQAIALHPTGSPDPSPLVRLIFVADYLEPTRRHLDAADRDLLERTLKGELDLKDPLLRGFAREDRPDAGARPCDSPAERGCMERALPGEPAEYQNLS